MNIKRYLFPASIAAVLHTALLLALPDVTVQVAAPAARPTKPPVKPVQIDLPLTARDDNPPSTEPVRPLQKGSEPVEIPEPPIGPRPVEFSFEVTKAVYRAEPLAPPGQPGVPEGNSFTGGDGQPHAFLSPDDLDRMPRATVQMPPDYPSTLRQAGIGGEVVVEFTVDSAGRVMTAQVLKSTHREFEDPTLRAVLRWRFEPGRRHGQVVPFRMVVPVDFSMGGI